MIPTKILIAPSFETLRQHRMHLCSICSAGSLPSSEKQPQFFYLPTRPSLIIPCYFSHLISVSLSHSLCSRWTGLLSQSFCICCCCLSVCFLPSPQPPRSQWGLPWPPGFALPLLPIFLPYFVFLHLTCHPLILQVFD